MNDLPNGNDYRHLMQAALLELSALQAKVIELEQATQEPIALIGMGCRFPGAINDPEMLWQVCQQGQTAITEVPGDRWNADDYYDPDLSSDNTTNSRWGGFLTDIDQFDPGFFGLSQAEAAGMDPQQRLLLEVSWTALEQAGYDPQQLAGSQTGVFVGIATGDYHQQMTAAPARSGTGVANSMAANRLSYFFDFRGPSLTTDTACSSSLVAVHLACRSLRQRESNLALVGGVNVLLSPENEIAFAQAGLLSGQGRCNSFDAAADGYVRSEGCGMVVLKRLADARTAGDRILGIIRGTAVNHNGRSIGLTAPNGLAQQAVIRAALQEANLSPQDIDYVEANGTGTPLGDRIELQALAAVLASGRAADRLCGLGSVKTNLGNLEAASGIAALIRTVLCLQHGAIPPHPHFTAFSPDLEPAATHFVIPTADRPAPIQPRFAGVNGFGFGGTNVHLVLERAVAKPEARQHSTATPTSASGRSHHLLTLSAKTEAALIELTKRYTHYLQAETAASIPDLCYTTNIGRSHFAHRLALVVPVQQESPETGSPLASRLQTWITHREPQNSSSPLPAQRPKIAFLFAGQGSHYLNMGQHLYETQPTFRATIDQCNDLLRPDLDIPLLKVLYPATATSDSSLLDQSIYAQPALFAVQYALAQLWRSWGVEPDAVLGHSVGEYVAACVAGSLSLADALRLSVEPGRLMATQPQPGQMVAVFAEPAVVETAIAPVQDAVAIAALNGPTQTVIAGDRQAVAAAISRLEADVMTRELNVAHAFHSPLIDPIQAPFAQALKQMQFHPPQLPFISHQTGHFLRGIPDAAYWQSQLRSPVRFSQGVQTLAASGYKIFLEVGATDTLVSMGKRCLPKGTAFWLTSLKQDHPDWETLLTSLAVLYQQGFSIDWAEFHRHSSHQRLALPTYPFQHKRCWLESF